MFAAADDDLLFAAVDLRAALLIDGAQIAAVEPAVIVQRLVGAFRIVQVAYEHMRPANLFPSPWTPGATS